VNEPVKRSPPVLGALSILMPAFGAASWWFVATHPKIGKGLDGYAGAIIGLGLVALSAVLVMGGVTCGIAALIRRERWRLLALLGVLVNAAIILRFAKH